MPSYSELLKDARWTARRRQIYERAGNRCQECARSGLELHAHHLYYERGRPPWDYPDSALRCLCSDCHANATHEARLSAGNDEIARQIQEKQASQRLVTTLAATLGPPKRERKLRAPEVWDKIKVLGETKSRAMMGCLARLSHQGLSDAALLEIATHYSVNHASIANPYAYYSKRGFAAVGAIVRSQDREHQDLLRDERQFLGEGK